MSPESRRLAGILLVLPVVVTGNVSMLSMLMWDEEAG
jgi:hypothetical protein